jgi:hypothetical protein
MNGKYPYPFMNQLPVLVAYFGTTALCVTAMYLISLGGRSFAQATAWMLQKPLLYVEDEEAVPQENGHTTKVE